MKIITQLMVLVIAGALFIGSVSAGNDDSNLKEVGIEWVNDYGNLPGYRDLWHNDENAEGFYNKLGSEGWTKRFDYGDDLAWEQDFKKQSLGGTDYAYADNVDFVFFSGHGDVGKFVFGTTVDDHFLTHQDAEWGDKDLEWIAIDACRVLNNDDGNVFDRWGTWFTGSDVFNGLHQIQGFDTITHDVTNRGDKFAYYMTRPWYWGGAYNIEDAWFKACDETEGNDVTAAVMYACGPNDAEYDYLPGYGSTASDSDDPNCIGWTPHTC